MQQIKYLSTILPLPLLNGESEDDLHNLTPDTLASRITKLLDEATDLKLNLTVANMIVASAGKLFVENLESLMPYFGQTNSPQWTAGFKVYATALIKGFKGDAKWKMLEEADRQILKLVRRKLWLLLDCGAMGVWPFLPPLQGNVPLLCPSFMVALFAQLQELAPALSLASFSLHNNCFVADIFFRRSHIALSSGWRTRRN
jgi:hypothetical protein